jgi:hypothetical protein
MSGMKNVLGSRKFAVLCASTAALVAVQMSGVDPTGGVVEGITGLGMTALGAQGLADFKNGGTPPKH